MGRIPTRLGNIALLVLVAAFLAPAQARAKGMNDPVVVGLDHIPIAVADLEQAADDFMRLGFTLKPGRVHENGIRNRHLKFADGSEIELITATKARDALTREYLRHLEKGDGPAFVGFFAPDPKALKTALGDLGKPKLHFSNAISS